MACRAFAALLLRMCIYSVHHTYVPTWARSDRRVRILYMQCNAYPHHRSAGFFLPRKSFLPFCMIRSNHPRGVCPDCCCSSCQPSSYPNIVPLPLLITLCHIGECEPCHYRHFESEFPSLCRIPWDQRVPRLVLSMIIVGQSGSVDHVADGLWYSEGF